MDRSLLSLDALRVSLLLCGELWTQPVRHESCERISGQSRCPDESWDEEENKGIGSPAAFGSKSCDLVLFNYLYVSRLISVEPDR